jgi:hypothetical protein
VGSGPGIPAEVKVYPASGSGLVEHLAPFGSTFRGGVSVAAGPLAKTGPDDLIVGSGPGMAPTVDVYNGDTPTPIESLTPFARSFQGGVVVAAGDLGGTGNDDVVVGTGSGITSVVRSYLGATSTRLWSVDALGQAFKGGITVATFAPGNGVDDVVVGAGSGGGAQVKLLSGAKAAFAGTFLGSPGSSAVAVAAG